MNNFEQIKSSKNEYEMACKIALIINKFSLYNVDESVVKLLILLHLREVTKDKKGRLKMVDCKDCPFSDECYENEECPFYEGED